MIQCIEGSFPLFDASRAVFIYSGYDACDDQRNTKIANQLSPKPCCSVFSLDYFEAACHDEYRDTDADREEDANPDVAWQREDELFGRRCVGVQKRQRK